jgi:hypothetical protein
MDKRDHAGGRTKNDFLTNFPRGATPAQTSRPGPGPLIIRASLLEGLAMATSWKVATPPESYGAVDDEMVVRHVRVPKPSSLLQIKCEILHAYEDQYKPEEITLFTRKYDDEPLRVTTDRAAAIKLLSYSPDWESLQQGDSDPAAADTVLLVVSAMDESEASLLVLPAAHSPPDEVLSADIMAPAEGRIAFEPLPGRLAASPGLFDPLPLPAHVDDWLAQYREAPQSVGELATRLQALPPHSTPHTDCPAHGQRTPPQSVPGYKTTPHSIPPAPPHARTPSTTVGVWPRDHLRPAALR